MAIVRDGWIMCPHCKVFRTSVRARANTEGINIPVYCKHCRTEYIVNIKSQSG